MREREILLHTRGVGVGDVYHLSFRFQVHRPFRSEILSLMSTVIQRLY